MKLQSYFKFLLIAIPVVMISWQLYVSNFDTLTSWKGGGYGMYTDSHRFQGYISLKNKEREQRIYPLSKDEIKCLDSLNHALYLNDKKASQKFAFYPTRYFESYRYSDYVKSQFKTGDTISFISVDLDLKSKSISRKILFEHAL